MGAVRRAGVQPSRQHGEGDGLESDEESTSIKGMDILYQLKFSGSLSLQKNTLDRCFKISRRNEGDMQQTVMPIVM